MHRIHVLLCDSENGLYRPLGEQMAFIERKYLGPVNGTTKLLIDWPNSVSNKYCLVTKVSKGMLTKPLNPYVRYDSRRLEGSHLIGQ